MGAFQGCWSGSRFQPPSLLLSSTCPYIGHHYLQEVAKRGYQAFLCERIPLCTQDDLLCITLAFTCTIKPSCQEEGIGGFSLSWTANSFFSIQKTGDTILYLLSRQHCIPFTLYNSNIYFAFHNVLYLSFLAVFKFSFAFVHLFVWLLSPNAMRARSVYVSAFKTNTAWCRVDAW